MNIKQLIRASVLLYVVLFSGGLAQAQLPCGYSYVTWPNMDCGFGPFPGSPVAVNVHGHVTGYFIWCGEPEYRTFLWTGGPTTTILPLPAGYKAMRAESMNDLGEIVGTLELPSGTPNPIRAFLRRANGQVINLGLPPGATWSFATGINNKSEITGFAFTPTDSRAFLWKDGTFTYLNLPIGPNSRGLGINDASQITGWMGDSSISISHAFIWQNGRTTIINPLPGTTNASGVAISQSGAVAGESRMWIGQNVFERSFFYQNGVTIELAHCGKYQSNRATGCSDTVVIGAAEDGPEDPTVFIWSGAQMRKLSDLAPIPNLILPGVGPISIDGRIAVAGRVGGNWMGLVLTPVYAPSADVTDDCRVNVNDLLVVINEWGKSKSVADINQDGIVNVLDLHCVIEDWGEY